MTELSPIVLAGGEHAHVPGSSGRLVANTACKIVDPETFEALPLGAEGELVVRGPQVMLGYKDRPDANSECLVPVDEAQRVVGGVDYGGVWMRTGDVARVDADGNVFISERIKELIKVKAFQVAPAELEAKILEDEAITDCCVIGVPHDKFGQVPKAFVVARADSALAPSKGVTDEARAEAVLAKLRPRLAEFKWPHEVVFVESIPKSPSGKILRRLLR